MAEIRKASLRDIRGIAVVVREVWNQRILPDVCEAQTQNPDCALWVAVERDQVAGFVSAFLTVDNLGNRRWEIDLLAVRPTNQGQGLGRQLVEAACQNGEPLKAPIARASIRVENVASRKAFENAGFTTDGEVHKLLLWEPASRGSSIYGGEVSFIPVDTLTYRGLWMEGLTAKRVNAEEQRNAVRTARSIIAGERRANTGALVPASEEHRLADDVRETAKLHGEYCWFIKTLAT